MYLTGSSVFLICWILRFHKGTSSIETDDVWGNQGNALQSRYHHTTHPIPVTAFLVPERGWDNHDNSPNNYTQGRKCFFAPLFALQPNNLTPDEPFSSAFSSHSCRIRISYPPHRPQMVSPHRESVRHCDLYLDFDSEKYAANGVKQYTLFLRKKYHTQCGSNTLNTSYRLCHLHQPLCTSMDEPCSSWRDQILQSEGTGMCLAHLSLLEELSCGTSTAR